MFMLDILVSNRRRRLYRLCSISFCSTVAQQMRLVSDKLLITGANEACYSQGELLMIRCVSMSFDFSPRQENVVRH